MKSIPPVVRSRRAASRAKQPVDSRGFGSTPRSAPSPNAAGSSADDVSAITDAIEVTPTVGPNLRRLRTRRGLSLDGLARASGVSRAMLGQIELNQSTPTINVLWKVARALNVPFSALITQPNDARVQVLPATNAKILTSHDGAFKSRALFPFDEPRRVEFYELRLTANAVEHADAHAPGTMENLVVTHGAVEIRVGDDRYQLGLGDAIQFAADVPHEYGNNGQEEAVMYLVMTYADEVG